MRCDVCGEICPRAWYVVAGTFGKNFIDFRACEGCRNFIQLMMAGAAVGRDRIPLKIQKIQDKFRKKTAFFMADGVVVDDEPHFPGKLNLDQSIKEFGERLEDAKRAVDKFNASVSRRG